jgi:hypothetical protein
MMNGFTTGDFATPFANKLHYVIDRDILIDAVDNKMKFLLQKELTNEYTALTTEALDVHVMNKRSLIRVIRGEHTHV